MVPHPLDLSFSDHIRLKLADQGNLSIQLHIRHPETVSNRNGLFTGTLNPALTRKGEEQARQTAKFLKDFPIDLIVSSPQQRAFYMASQIANARSIPLPLIPLPFFLEINHGAWEGYSKKEIAMMDSLRYEDWISNPYGCKKPGENLKAVYERVSSGLLAISQVSAILKFRLVSVISHEWTIAAILGSIVGGDSVRNLRPDNAAITVIIERVDGYSISLFNSSNHLEQKEFEITQSLSY